MLATFLWLTLIAQYLCVITTDVYLILFPLICCSANDDAIKCSANESETVQISPKLQHNVCVLPPKQVLCQQNTSTSSCVSRKQ